MSFEIGHWILDKNHEPVKCTLMEWAQWMEVHSNKIVEQTEIKGYMVSTVFLGLDHNFGGKGPPVLFETMVFRADDWNKFDKKKRGLPEQDMNRYCTWDEAMKGHRRFVWQYKGGEIIEGGAA
jgi:hypothetical protein